MLQTTGLTRPSSGRAKAGFANFVPPLKYNVRPLVDTPNRPLVAILMALLIIAALVMWQDGELDAKASVLLLAFAALGVALLLPRAYDYLCMGVFMALSIPVVGLLSGRVANLQGRSKPDIAVNQDEPRFWVMLIAWAAMSLAVIVFGALRVRKYRRLQKAMEEAEGKNPFSW